MKDKYLIQRQKRKIVYCPAQRGRQIGILKRKLQIFGYLLKDICDCKLNYYCNHMARSIKLYQKYYGLPLSGYIDSETLKMLTERRCGHRDLPEKIVRAWALSEDAGDDESDAFTFRFNSNPWETYNLNYNIYNGTSDLSNEASIIRDAFDVWENVSPLRFSSVSNINSAHLRLGWETGAHQGEPEDQAFDGDGGVLAHAYFPENGNIHFDDAERWRDPDTSSNDFDLLNVAIHEIGHALGLGHAPNKSSIMYPFYQQGKHDLSEADIRAILSLYPFLVGTNDRAKAVSLWAFSGGTHSTLIDLGSRKKFLAWGQITFIDSLTDFDRDNAVALDIFTIDGNNTQRVGFGGDHLGTDGAPSNLFVGAHVGYGQEIQFRLSTIHSSDLEAYGNGCVIILD